LIHSRTARPEIDSGQKKSFRYADSPMEPQFFVSPAAFPAWLKPAGYADRGSANGRRVGVITLEPKAG